MKRLIKNLREWVPQLEVWAIIPDLLAVAALILCVVMPGSVISGLALALPLGLIVHRQRKHIFSLQRSAGGLGSYLVSRYLLLAAVAARMQGNDAFSGIEIAIVAVVALFLAGERIIRAGNRLVMPLAANLPKIKLSLKPRIAYRVVFVLNTALTAMMILNSQFTGALVYGEVALGVTILVVTGTGMRDVVTRLRNSNAIKDRRHGALQKLAPRFILYWDGDAPGAYQVTMWLPYLDRLGLPYLIVVRRAALVRELTKHTKRPIFVCGSLEDIDDVIVESLRGIFYVNNAARNAHMTRYAHLVHIQLNHGESDKAASINPAFRMYDFNFVAGQAAIDRFAANNVPMPSEMFRIVGRPQADDVLPAEQEIGQIASPTVLYAPTWIGLHKDANYSSLPVGEQIVRALLERGCRVVFRPHPFAMQHPQTKLVCQTIVRLLEQDQHARGVQHLFGAEATTKRSVAECFNSSDAMIADVSSVASDYLHSGKPLAMVATRHSATEFEAAFPTARAAYILETAGGATLNLDGVLDQLLTTDPKRSVRSDLAAYYLGDFPGETSTERFVTTALDALGLSSPRPTFAS